MSNPPKPNNLKLRRIPKKSPKIKKKAKLGVGEWHK